MKSAAVDPGTRDATWIESNRPINMMDAGSARVTLWNGILACDSVGMAGWAGKQELASINLTPDNFDNEIRNTYSSFTYPKDTAL